MLELKNISLSYQEKVILSNLNLEIKKGENVCISGPSGTGKTTILNIIQGNIEANTGEVIIDSLRLKPRTVKQIRNKISWLPQNINLLVNNAKELITLLEAESHEKKTIEFLNELGLDKSYLKKSFNEISGGQKQRIIISICLAFDKEIIILDEPTSSLDDNSIKLLINCINKLDNKTVISCSHNSTWINNSDKELKL